MTAGAQGVPPPLFWQVSEREDYGVVLGTTSDA
ncbi:MAG: hypothetical protein JWO98_159 [Frankiales bacterium]|nr:hypothetical protein [Frankiales bacterium]